MISVITVNYNGFRFTCELIESLYRYPGKIGEIIVVDNGSRNNEAEAIRQKYPEVIAIRSEKNLGFAGGNNLGIRQSKGDFLLFLNNDTTIREDISQALLDVFRQIPEAGIVCPKIRFEYFPDKLQFAGFTPLSSITLRNRCIGFNETDRGQYDTLHPTSYAHGAAMMVPRKLIEKVGDMPEIYFLYYEELDWSEMFKRAGYKIYVTPQAIVYHKESATTGPLSELKTYYLTRNRLLFAYRNLKRKYRLLSLGYQLSIALPKNVITTLFKRRFSLCKASLKGARDFFSIRKAIIP